MSQLTAAQGGRPSERAPQIAAATSGFYKPTADAVPLHQPLHARLGQGGQLPEGGRYLQDVKGAPARAAGPTQEQAAHYDSLILQLYKIKSKSIRCFVLTSWCCCE